MTSRRLMSIGISAINDNSSLNNKNNAKEEVNLSPRGLTCGLEREYDA